MLGRLCKANRVKIANYRANTANRALRRTMATFPPFFGIEFPVVPETELGHLLHAVELLRTANLMARLRVGRRAPRLGWRLCTAHGQPLPIGQGVGKALLAEGLFDGPPDAQWVLSQHAGDAPALRQMLVRQGPLRHHLTMALDEGQRVLTQGNGAWLAAGTGRLNGHCVALPWYWATAFHRDHPDIGLAPGTSACVSGPWLSAALPQDTGELLLALVDLIWDHHLHQSLAAALRPDAARQRAAQEALLARHVPTTRESALARAIEHLEKHMDQPYALDALAAAAAVSPRTLLRHFQQSLGHSPLDHLHRLRCDRARLLLEITLESVPSIAGACGYDDPAAFRRIFTRYVGLTPTAYRQRHSLRAPRQRWRVAL